MQPLKQHHGIVCPLDRANVDTDAIIPKQFLKRIERSGYGQYLFYDWRFNENRDPIDSFVLHQSRYQGASILLARNNFGCGSSREHAPWALEDYGFRVVIAPSFADIFYNNCFKNGMLPVCLSEDQVEILFQKVAQVEGYQLTVDLETQRVYDASGLSYDFTVDSYRRHCLLHGLDDIGITLQSESKIAAYEQQIPKYYAVSSRNI